MPKLLMIAPAPVIETADEKLKLDIKFVEGMRNQTDQWNGPVICILKRGATHIPFGATYDPADLGFTLVILSRDALIAVNDAKKNDLIYASADMHDTLHLVDPDQRPEGTKLVYSIEYDLDTRIRIAALDRDRGTLRKLRTKLWLLNQERRRRKALRRCDGIQANGYPAFAAYSPLNKRTMMYLDGRMSNGTMATPDEQVARAAYLRSGSPLRLVHSGRLEPMKGGQDLIPVVKALQKSGVEFTLDIFGGGSLTPDITEAITTGGLEEIVRMHGPVDFDEVLVPFVRQKADVFLSCHRQSDPSCTYLESMGCGVPVIGYQNAMWQNLAHRSKGGWAVPLGETESLAKRIVKLDREREALVEAGNHGLNFAKDHAFETEFTKRMQHLSEFVT